MIKDVMVRLEGTLADDLRLAAAADIARLFESHIVGLFLNIVPPALPADPEGGGIAQTALLVEEARAAGDKIATLLTARLAQLGTLVEIRRFDIFADEISDVCSREARSVDTFVALRPNSVPEEPEHIVESVLFGSGRHVFLVPPGEQRKTSFESVLVAWNGSREAARALAEALPYLKRAETVTVCVVDDKPRVNAAILGADAKKHLEHHGIHAALHHLASRNRDVAATLVAEAGRRKAGLIVMGGYGHTRLREWLLGGVTFELLREAPVPLLVAH
jgi:nucleotide-binding universal stress UspA family protein